MGLSATAELVERQHSIRVAKFLLSTQSGLRRTSDVPYKGGFSASSMSLSAKASDVPADDAVLSKMHHTSRPLEASFLSCAAYSGMRSR